MADEDGVTYVFDRGSVDYAAYDRYCEKKIFFAPRLKNNAVIESQHMYELPPNRVVSLDEKIVVRTQQKRIKHPSKRSSNGLNSISRSKRLWYKRDCCYESGVDGAHCLLITDTGKRRNERKAFAPVNHSDAKDFFRIPVAIGSNR